MKGARELNWVLHEMAATADVRLTNWELHAQIIELLDARKRLQALQADLIRKRAPRIRNGQSDAEGRVTDDPEETE